MRRFRGEAWDKCAYGGSHKLYVPLGRAGAVAQCAKHNSMGVRLLRYPLTSPCLMTRPSRLRGGHTHASRTLHQRPLTYGRV